MEDTRIPVIVGVGQVNDRPEPDAPGLNSLDLMAEALRRADADGGGGWLARLDALSVVAQLSFPELGDVSRPLAEVLGATPRHCMQTRYPMGDSPVMLLNEAARNIASGELEAAAVVGGEALRTAARRARQARDAVRESATSAAKPLRQRYGLVAPTDIYPLYENACRAAWGQTLAQAQQESAAIWALMSQVAARSPGAWLRTPRSAEEILTPSPDNRPIAFPYTKLMVANASVNQGAGFIVASLARARAAGLDETRLVYVGAGAAAHEPGDILARDRFDRSASLEATLRRVLDFNALEPDDLDAVELYSCFPCIPKMARRVLGWPLDKPVSAFGGLTFGGGPIGNYMSHALAAIVEALRDGARHGLLFGNGGYATANHAIVVSRDPALAAGAAREPSVQAEADAARGPAPPLADRYEGAAAIETYTVFYDRAGAVAQGVVLARTPAGARVLALVDAHDAQTVAFLTDGEEEPVAREIRLRAGEDGALRCS